MIPQQGSAGARDRLTKSDCPVSYTMQMEAFLGFQAAWGQITVPRES